MKVSYNKLWKMLIDKNMQKKDLQDAVKMSPNTMAKMGRNENISMDVQMVVLPPPPRSSKYNHPPFF